MSRKGEERKGFSKVRDKRGRDMEREKICGRTSDCSGTSNTDRSSKKLAAARNFLAVDLMRKSNKGRH